MITRLITRCEGQGMTEYALVLGLMTMAVIAGMVVYGATLQDLINTVISLW